MELIRVDHSACYPKISKKFMPGHGGKGGGKSAYGRGRETKRGY